MRNSEAVRIRLSERFLRMRGSGVFFIVVVSLAAFFFEVSNSLILQTPSTSRRPFVHTSWIVLADSRSTSLESEQFQSNNDKVQEFQEIKRNVVQFLKKSEYDGAKAMIRAMMEYLQEADELSAEDKVELSQVVDDSCQAFFNRAFAPPYRGRAASDRVSMGASLIQLQLSSSESLCEPYNQIPKSTLLSGLKALTGVKESSQTTHDLRSANAAFRVLQRLVTGVGVRNGEETGMRKLHESDFNRVLNAYAINGDMTMAHKVVALQERTPHAPSLSAVAYSILLKGYGRLRDINSIEMLLNRANACGVEADIIMLNSLIDAYVNCNQLQIAQQVFHALRDPNAKAKLDPGHQQLLDLEPCPVPNQRTYNIVLKGLAKKGDLQEALSLTEEIKTHDFWDHVTTNTLVKAAVRARDYEFAEQLLEEYTEEQSSRFKGRHQNAEAYTSLIDGYSKDGDVKKAGAVLKLMGERKLNPNEFAYTPVVGAFGRRGHVENARAMMSYMRRSGLKVKTVTYNALISGLVHKRNDLSPAEFDIHLDHSLRLLNEMMDQGLRPNANTVSVILGAFGKCEKSRVAEALRLVENLDADGVISLKNAKVATSIIQLHGVAGNLRGAIEAFERMRKPDVAAINALLHTCALCQNDRVAQRTFNYFFSEKSRRQVPDVTSFSSMITCWLKKNSFEGSMAAQKLYENMKYKRRIIPDNALVDIILKTLVENSRTRSIHPNEVRFVAEVLRDAARMEWGEGQLEKRKMAINAVMSGRMAGTWEEEATLFGLNDAVDPTDDDMFKEHGWNKVDSGFQLWGQRQAPADDVFLRSKGWNSVDSGFRII